MKPWGRLTLQSGKPRMDVNVSSSVLYYTPFESYAVQEASVVVPTNYNGLFDVFWDQHVGTGEQAISFGAFNSPKIKQSGVYYLQNTGSLYIGSVNIQNGIINWQPRPPSVPYGTNNILGVFNAYNRLPVYAICTNSNSTWQYASSGLRFADNSSSMRISWVDGLGDVACKGSYTVSVAGATPSPAAATVGVGLDMDSYPINWGGLLPQGAMNNNATGMQITGRDITNGVIGLHNWQAIEQSTSVPVIFFGNNFCALTAELSL